MFKKVKFFVLNINFPLFKEIMILAFPVILSNISRVFMHLTDTAMVGHLGKNELAGVGMAGMGIWIAISTGIGFRIATQAVASRRLGQEKFYDCGVALRNAQVMCLVLTLPLSILGHILSEKISIIFLQDLDVIKICSEYLSIVFFSVYFSVSSFVFQGFYTGIEKTKILMYTTIISNLINVYLNAGFIYGYEKIYLFSQSNDLGYFHLIWSWYDFPELGAMGAAIATLISSILMLFIYFIYLFNRKIGMNFKIFSFDLDFIMMKKQFSIGYPQSISEMFLNGAFIIFYKIMGLIGTTQLAATQIVFSIAHASFLPAVGVGQACATLVGKYLGRKDINKATQSMIEGLRGSLLIMGSMGLIFILFPTFIVSLFTNDNEIMSLGIKILPWVGAIQFVDAFAITLWFALSGAGDTKFTAYLAIILSWGVFVPLSYILGIKLSLGFFGPWFALGVHLIIEAIIITIRVIKGKWKYITI